MPRKYTSQLTETMLELIKDGLEIVLEHQLDMLGAVQWKKK
jgi:hypothetical protein